MKTTNWKNEIIKILNDREQNIVVDLRVLTFISELLVKEREKAYATGRLKCLEQHDYVYKPDIIKIVEGKKEEDQYKWIDKYGSDGLVHEPGDYVWNKALSDIISAIKEL